MANPLSSLLAEAKWPFTSFLAPCRRAPIFLESPFVKDLLHLEQPLSFWPGAEVGQGLGRPSHALGLGSCLAQPWFSFRVLFGQVLNYASGPVLPKK